MRETTQRFIDEMGSLKSTFTEFMKAWPNGDSIRGAPRDFAVQGGAVVAALSVRIDRENHELTDDRRVVIAVATRDASMRAWHSCGNARPRTPLRAAG